MQEETGARGGGTDGGAPCAHGIRIQHSGVPGESLCGDAAGGGGALENARATAARVQARLHAELAEANRQALRPYALATSVGAAVFDPASGATLSALMLEADAALYERKRARKRGTEAAPELVGV